MEDGALLPSPTRDKLMPTIPKSKDDESYNSQRGSPKKSAISRHGSPQKGSPQKMQKKTIKQGKFQLSKVIENINTPNFLSCCFKVSKINYIKKNVVPFFVLKSSRSIAIGWTGTIEC